MHRYILSCKSTFFADLFHQKRDDAAVSSRVTQIELPDCNVEYFKPLLVFLYTDTSDFLTIGKTISTTKFGVSASAKSRADEVNGREISVSNGQTSAFAVYNNARQKAKSAKSKTSNKQHNGHAKPVATSPVQVMQDMARRFGVSSLVKRLEAVCIKGITSFHWYDFKCMYVY